MFSLRYILISAILFTTATLFWGFNLFAAAKVSGKIDLFGGLIVAVFLALTGIYWAMYFRRKAAHSQTSGTE